MKSWQTKKGKDMITVQLVKNQEDGPPIRPAGPDQIPQPSNIQDAVGIVKDNREMKTQATILKKKIKDKSNSITVVEADDDVTFKIS